MNDPAYIRRDEFNRLDHVAVVYAEGRAIVVKRHEDPAVLVRWCKRHHYRPHVCKEDRP